MKVVPLSIFFALASISHCTSAGQLPAANELVWQTIAFGQSTDVNFATNVLPNKVGTNQATLANGEVVQAGPLKTPFHLESRGGKIANSHDGLTFYYTRIPANANALLEAEITVEQFGPENEALPAGQEGAGLLIRDILGKPRLEKIEPGYEEFPAAANMVMNAIMTQDKKDNHRVKLTMISRNGVLNSWGMAALRLSVKVTNQRSMLLKPRLSDSVWPAPIRALPLLMRRRVAIIGSARMPGTRIASLNSILMATILAFLLREMHVSQSIRPA